MTKTQLLRPGDFTGLARDYSDNRPDYSHSVLGALIGIQDRPLAEIDFADVGAGTGIWTRMVHSLGVHSSVAVEPNDDMRNSGISDSQGMNIRWFSGSAEKPGLPNKSFDWVTMASSFHWADFEKSTREFHRILRSGGRFTALWNPRLIEVNPLLVKIEDFLNVLQPNIRRVSSGRSGITEHLTGMLSESPYFEDIVYVEGRHDIKMTPTRYIGAWRSVNDLRVQLGPEKFKSFLNFVEEEISGQQYIQTTYLTRAWSARKVD